jgi:GntR family transcriptional repressor for pyruvate dehydrogenase complex
MSKDSVSFQPDELFQTVERENSLVSRVARQIEHLIVEGHLKPGEHLPPQSELARQFDVSRTVVREAVRTLVTKSLLQVRTGSGTIVLSPTAESVTQSMSLFLRAGRPALDYTKVHEIRRILEVEIAGLAAERRTPEDLEAMEAILSEAAEIQDDRDRFTQCDMSFHTALAQSTHNELFSVLLDSLVDTMFKIRYLAYDVPGTPARAIKHHRAIFEQVKAGDVKGARRAMRRDLIEAERVQLQVLTLQAAGDAE